MTAEYEERAILARRIAEEIAEIAKTPRQIKTVIRLVEEQFDNAEVVLREYAIGDAGDEIQISLMTQL